MSQKQTKRHHTRERMSTPDMASSRAQRRKLARKNAAIARKESIAQRMAENPRLVKFAF